MHLRNKNINKYFAFYKRRKKEIPSSIMMKNKSITTMKTAKCTKHATQLFEGS